MDEKRLKSLVGDNLRRLMKAQGFDEYTLSAAIGKGPDVIRRLLSGETRVNAEHVALLCAAFRVAPARLFEGDETAFDDGYRSAVRRMLDFLGEIDPELSNTAPDAPVEMESSGNGKAAKGG